MAVSRGFTLFELLVYMMCILFFLSGISVITVQTVNAFRRMRNTDHVLQLWSACASCARDARLCTSPDSIKFFPHGVSWRMRSGNGPVLVSWKVYNGVIKRCTRVCSCVVQSIASFSCEPVYKKNRLCGMWITLVSAKNGACVRCFIHFDTHCRQEL